MSLETRKIKGRLYYAVYSACTKSQAKNVAKRLKLQGKNYRIMPVGKTKKKQGIGYIVYVTESGVADIFGAFEATF